MGMPAFLGFYVTHNWERGYMSFAPHPDSDRVPLQPGTVPKKALAVKYSRTNTENGNFWSFGIALIAAIAFSIGWSQYWKTVDVAANYSENQAVLIYLGGILFSVVVFFVFRVVLKYILWPGDQIWEVTPADEAVANVSCSPGHLTIFGFFAYLMHRFCCSSKSKKKARQA